MTLIDSIFLGVIQGFTEFLPVSSSGHLEIAKILFELDLDNNLLFSVVVHLATALATIIVFRQKIFQLIKTSTKFITNKKEMTKSETLNSKYSFNILISAIPVLIIYILFNNQIEELFEGDLRLVGMSLLATTAFLISTVIFHTRHERTDDNEIDFKKSITIGIAQAISILPGISRSGATISTGLVTGLTKKDAAEFSFLMVLIPILGANTLEILDAISAGISVESVEILIAGFISAFITGYLAIKIMLSVIQKSKLHLFAMYTFVLGIVSIIFA